MKTSLKALLFSLMLAATAAFAADLTTAKQQGLVGEQSNGYLGLVKGDAPPDVKALVADVNGQRRAQFRQIAAKNGIAEDEAAKVFAREAAARTAPGNYIQNPAGGWVKK
ncbi:MAG: YdbL family protein [Propionivibrio sp.]